jgi:hypothetical protein
MWYLNMVNSVFFPSKYGDFVHCFNKFFFVGFALPFFFGQVGTFGPKKIPWLGEWVTTTNLAKLYI